VAFSLGCRTAEIAATLDTLPNVPNAVKFFHRNHSTVTGVTQRFVSSRSRGGAMASEYYKRVTVRICYLTHEITKSVSGLTK
jgi:hypothetical protein